MAAASAAHVEQDATAERLAAEAELLAAVHELRSAQGLDPLFARIAAAPLAPRMRPALIQLAVERALEVEGPSRIATGTLPGHALARVRAEGGEPVPGLPAPEARPELGPARPDSAVVFVVDGLRKDILDAMIAAGRLPNVRRHLLDRGLTVDRMVSVFPTVTPPNSATMLTGVLPDRHKIPALAWYDGAAGTARLYTSLRARDVNRDLPPSATTLWEHLRDRFEVATVGMPIERGAWSRWFHLFYPDHGLATVGAQYLQRAGFLPPVLGMWFLDLDAASHLGGTFSPGAEACLEKLDRELGMLCETLIRRGTYDRTLIVWASDHGSQPTLRNVDIVGDLARAGLACKTVDLKIDPFVTKAMELRLKGAPAVCINLGAGSGSLYLKRAQGVPDVEAALRAPVDILKTLTEHAAVDVVAFSQGGRVRVLSARGRGEIESRRTGAGLESRYRVVAGEDPLGVAPALSGRWLSLHEWVEATAATARPAAVPGLAAFLACGRGGDVVFTAKPGVNFSKHFHTRGGYHGGLTHAEAVTRLMMAGPGVPRARVAAASMADITPTILTVLGVPHDASKLDGRSVLAPRHGPGVAGLPVGVGVSLMAEVAQAKATPRAARGDASGDRTRLGFAVDPRLEVMSLCRVPDWRLDARGDTAPWWPLLLPAAMSGTAVQMDFRRAAGRADVVASPGLVRTERGSRAGDRVYPTLDLRAATPVVDGRRGWLGLTGGAEVLADGERVLGRADAGLLVTCNLGAKVRAFGFAGPFLGSVAGTQDESGLRLKSGLEVYTQGRGSAIVEAVRDADISRVSAVVNLPAF